MKNGKKFCVLVFAMQKVLQP